VNDARRSAVPAARLAAERGSRATIT
jgi:hypothetical protein